MKMFYTCSIIVQMHECPHPSHSRTLSPTPRDQTPTLIWHKYLQHEEFFDLHSCVCGYKDFAGEEPMHARKSCKNQGKYLCQICGRSFELKKKMNKSVVDQFQYVIVTKRACNLCVWSSGPFYMGKRARHVNAIPT